MQASGKFTIAIHICLYLQFKGEDLVSSQQIAKSVQTNPVVIRRMVGSLRDKNIIGSVPGSKGGFYLKKPATEINLWEIYLAVKNSDLFYKPKSNHNCPVGSNLAILVEDTFTKAEISMRETLGMVNIDGLNKNLSSILELQEENFC